MKKTTRFTAMIAAMAMTMMSVGAMSAFAEAQEITINSESNPKGSSSQAINATYSQQSTADVAATSVPVYRVTIEWTGDMSVIYNASGNFQYKNWNPNTLTYSTDGSTGTNSGSGWSDYSPDTSATITNYSNVAIRADMSFVPGNIGLSTSPVTYDTNNNAGVRYINLGSAAAGISDTSSTGTATSGSITGTLDLAGVNIVESGVLGTYTVTID